MVLGWLGGGGLVVLVLVGCLTGLLVSGHHLDLRVEGWTGIKL